MDRERERWAERQLFQKGGSTEEMDEETDGQATDERPSGEKDEQ